MSRRSRPTRRSAKQAPAADVSALALLSEADVALQVRQRLVGPTLGWAAAPAVVWVGCEATGHIPSASAGAAIAVAAAAGAAWSLRRGASAVVSAWLRDQAVRVAESEVEAEQRQRVQEFWQQAGVNLDSAVAVLRSSQETMSAALQGSQSQNAAHIEDVRALTEAWLAYFRSLVDGIVEGVRADLSSVRQGRVPDRPTFPAMPAPQAGAFDDLHRELVVVGHFARDAVAQAAAANTGMDAELGVFAGIAKRLRSRADRVLVELDGLERSTEDPDRMQALLRVDHKVVQIRRDVEAVQVLAGGQLRQSGGPAEVSAVLRQATAEIEDFRRVDIRGAADVQVVAYARSGLIHVLAALLENACRFSRDRVVVASSLDSTGLVITVEDNGLHMPAEDLREVNRLLADPDPAIERTRLVEGRIGLLVTAKLARRYRLQVVLHPAAERGTRAVVTVPPNLLVYPAPQPVTIPAQPQPGATEDQAPVPTSAPAAETALASVSPLAASGSRPNLPRRRRTPPTVTPPARHARVADAPGDATPGLAGAFLSGAASHVDDDAPNAPRPNGP